MVDKVWHDVSVLIFPLDSKVKPHIFGIIVLDVIRVTFMLSPGTCLRTFFLRHLVQIFLFFDLQGIIQNNSWDLDIGRANAILLYFAERNRRSVERQVFIHMRVLHRLEISLVNESVLVRHLYKRIVKVRVYLNKGPRYHEFRLRNDSD